MEEEPTPAEIKNSCANRIPPITKTTIAWFFLRSLLLLESAGVLFAIFFSFHNKRLDSHGFSRKELSAK
jgi:hypothetical protein